MSDKTITASAKATFEIHDIAVTTKTFQALQPQVVALEEKTTFAPIQEKSPAESESFFFKEKPEESETTTPSPDPFAELKDQLINHTQHPEEEGRQRRTR